MAADKLHNVRAMVTDADFEGPTFWSRFNAGPADILWYHQSIARELVARIPDSRSVRLLVLSNVDLVDAVDVAAAQGS